MAHTKATGTTKNNRDSQPKYLGVKFSGGQITQIGNIIVKQRGSKFISGEGTKMGIDDTIYSIKNGVVKFTTKRQMKYDGNRKIKKIISVV